jgi:hypothetical protein
MRNKQEIIDKAQSLLKGAKEEFINKRIGKHFKNCKYNECSVARNIGKFHYCKLKSDMNNDIISKLFICDCDEWVNKCEEFECKNTTETAESDFNDVIKNPSRCSQLFPRLAALLWVLNDGNHRGSNLNSDSQNSIPHGHDKNEKTGLLRRIIRYVL